MRRHTDEGVVALGAAAGVAVVVAVVGPGVDWVRLGIAFGLTIALGVIALGLADLADSG